MEVEVIVGTYDQVLFSFTFKKEDETENKEIWKFAAKFTDQNHAGRISSVGAGGKFLASGSSDEQIRLYDLKKHVELGTIVEQSGTITCIEFVKSTHMLSASEDGTICIWDTKTWDCQKTLKGHRGGINSLSVHSSGRLALSVAKDKTIKTWNLLTGRAAYTTQLKTAGELVRWSPSGKSYVIASGSSLIINNINNFNEPASFQNEKQILAVEYLTETCLIIGGDSQNIVMYDTEKKEVLQKFQVHEKRTKGLCWLDHPHDADHMILFTTSTDGTLKATRLNKLDLSESPTLMSSVNIPGRPTCIAVKYPSLAKKTSNPEEEDHTDDSVVPSSPYPTDSTHSAGEQDDSTEVVAEVEPKKKKKKAKQKKSSTNV